MSKSKKETNEVSTSKVMASVHSVISFMKERVTADLVEASSQGKINLSDEELRKICFYIDASLTTSFVKSSTQIENSLKS